MTEKDSLDALHGDDETPTDRPFAPMLQMDGIRVATLVVLGALVVSSIFQGVYTVTNVQEQRVVNECYQQRIDQIIEWAETAAPAGRSDRAAQREFLLSDDIPYAAARERYLAKLDEADRARARVSLPTTSCPR